MIERERERERRLSQSVQSSLAHNANYAQHKTLRNAIIMLTATITAHRKMAIAISRFVERAQNGRESKERGS